jgi:hypothetical protein
VSALKVILFGGCAAVVVLTGLSAIRTFILPRATPTMIGRLLFVGVRRVTNLVAGRGPFEKRDKVLAYQAPVSLVALPVGWIALVTVSFAGMFWVVGVEPLREAFITSGSSLLTLGFARPEGLPAVVLAFAEGFLGLGLVALVITYLPSIYAAFARRETTIAMLEVLAGSPPTTRGLLLRHYRIGALRRLDSTWERWQAWFADLEESHSSLPILCFFRSLQPDRSWVTTAGCILDSAAVTVSCIEMQREPEAELMMRAGYVALRRISDYFSIAYDPDPAPDDPISVRRAEFDELWDALAAEGLPLKADRDQAWQDFAGWRVNYDTVLLALAGLTMAPPAAWSSDRAAPYRRPPITRRVRPNGARVARR